MRLTAFGIAVLLVLAGCAHKKPAEEPENSDETASSNEPAGESKDSKESAEPESSQLGTSGVALANTRTDKATVRDDIEEKRPAPCNGTNISDLLAALSQASCELPEGAAPSAQRVTKDTVDVSVSADSTKVAPGGAAKIFVVFKNKGKTKLPLDFTVDPDPRFRFELYTPKGARAADKPQGKEPSLPSDVSDNAGGEARTARVTLDPNGIAKLALDWQAVRYKWAAKEKAKGALPGHGFPREPAGPLPRGKYVLRVITPLANADDSEISQPRLNIEITGAPAPAPAPPPLEASRKKEAAPVASAAPPAASSEAAVESRFLKAVGAAPSATPAGSARPPGKKH